MLRHVIRSAALGATALTATFAVPQAGALAHQAPRAETFSTTVGQKSSAPALGSVAAGERLDASWQDQLQASSRQLVAEQQRKDDAAAAAAAAKAAADARAAADAQAKAQAAQQAAAAPKTQAPAPAVPSYSAGSVQQIIVDAFTPQGGAAVQWGLRIAKCESGYNPGAVNPSGASGLFQFMPSTFANTPPGKAGGSIWDPTAQSQAAAWMYSQGRQAEWQCN